MASTISLTGDWLVNIGNRNQTEGTGNLGTYATNGVAVTAAQVGLGTIDSLIIDPAAGYVFEWVKSTGKVKAYRSAAFTPAGTVAAPVFTGDALAAHRHDLYIATGATDSANTRVNAVTGELSITDAALTIAGIAAASGAAGGIVDVTAGTPAGTNSAPAFTGTAVAQGALAEVSNAVDLASITFRFRAIGR